jgi:hypothetical protein
MGTVSKIGQRAAINGYGSFVSRKPDIGTADESADTSAELWFSRIVRSLFAVKGGTALHCITGVDERTCQRYAAGHVRPPGYFIRTLLRSEEGWQFLAALMEGSEARWWAETKRARRIAEAVDRER